MGEHKIVPKGRTINWCRYPRTFTSPDGATIMVTYAPGIKDMNYSSYVDYVYDLRLVERWLKKGTFEPVVGNYIEVPDFAEAIEAIKAKYDKTNRPVEVALDLETVGLNPYHPDKYIVSAQLSHEPGNTDLVLFHSKAEADAALVEGTTFWKQMYWLLGSNKVSLRGANLKYDLNWLWVKGGLNCTNFKFDTMIVGSLLNENRRNSLNSHAKWYLPEMGGYDDEFELKYDKSRMDTVLKEHPKDYMVYAGGDTDACLQVSGKMKEELTKDKGLTRFYVNLLHPAVRAYEFVERTGILVDVDYYLDLELEIEEEMEQHRKMALAQLPYWIINKHSADLSNPAKASIINDFMFSPMGLKLKPKMVTEKTKAPSTAGEHLEMFKDHPKAGPFIQAVLSFAECSKVLGTYVIRRDAQGVVNGGFLSHLRSDRRFHATYFLHNTGDGSGGTNTGRVSVRDPAMQTVPKHTKWAKKLRRAFIAPDGMLMLGNDYSQGELKIAACLANEPTMLKAYQSGADLHAVTAARMVNMTTEEFVAMKNNPKKANFYATMRQRAKAGNFGFLYGMGAEGFVTYAAASYGVTLTLAEAVKIREAFFSAYPRLSKWHDNYKGIARQQGVIRSPLGRVRHLPMIRSSLQDVRAKAERQAINAPVQSTLSDLSLWATSLAWRNGWFDESPVVAMVHDQLVSYIPEDNWEYYAGRMKGLMENLPFDDIGWNPQLHFNVDCEVGQNMADMQEQKHIEALLDAA